MKEKEEVPKPRECHRCGARREAYWWLYCPCCGRMYQHIVEPPREIAPEVCDEGC